MFRNYLKTALRSLLRHKLYSIVTTTGLAIGIIVCLVIFVFIRYEESFDNFHAAKDRIFRVLTVDEKGNTASAVPFPLPTAIQTDHPQWQTTGIYLRHNLQITVVDREGRNQEKFKEKTGAVLVEPSLFTIFNFRWLAGDPAKALGAPNNIVLTRSTAEKYFGDWKDAMGGTLKVNNRAVFTVAGILADPPSNSDLQLKVILPYAIGHFSASTDWWTVNTDHECYIKLPADVAAGQASEDIRALSKKYRSADNKSVQTLQLLADVHFDATDSNLGGKTILRDRIRTLWLIAAFILVIACVNFVNLSTAQAENRSREIGVRKVLGSRRWQLTDQFLIEALILVLFGIILALALAVVLTKPIGRLLDMPLTIWHFLNGEVFIFLGIVTVIVTLLAGFYPAMVLSAFKPTRALKSKKAFSNRLGFTLRRGLVVFQFVIAQGLIIGTTLIIQQLMYFENTPMGFDKSAIITVPFPTDSISRTKMDYLRTRLMGVNGIEQVSFNNEAPASDDTWWTDFQFNHSAKGSEFTAINKSVDANYVKTYSLTLTAGRNITTTDSIIEFLVNEKLVRKLGFSDPHAVLNKNIRLGDGQVSGPVVGVTNDFQPGSLKDSLAPVIMANFKRNFNSAGIKMNAGSLAPAMASIRDIWNQTYPDNVFEYQFLDQKIEEFYKDEQQLSRLYKTFAGIAIFLSCLGLYGLASFMATQRIKEVGIRKVLGATSGNIVFLFSKEFLLLICIAFVIASPLAWYFVHRWLQGYVNRISISAWVFLAGGIATVAIALITVGYQAVKAASINPIKNLRTE